MEHPGDYYLENVRLSKQTRDEMPWGKEIPDEVFRHFVLPEGRDYVMADGDIVEFKYNISK